ncbi:MAG: hypothetical protein COB35_08830 [Gammaproteobacteria bacterium]|nr:MAG: hypothetical protein COB35_08830 [Gammaproteobacteria bacterium]
MKIKLLFILFVIMLHHVVQAQQFAIPRIVATEHNLLQYKENNQLKGPTIEILNNLLKDINIKKEVEFMPWARAYNIAENTANTIILSMVRTPEREHKFYWIGKVSQLVRVFVSLKSIPKNYVTNNQQALKKVVAVTRNSNSHKELLHRGFIEGKNLYIVSSPQRAFQLLLNKKVDLIYNDPNVIEDYINSETNSSAKIAFAPIKLVDQRDSYIAINKNSDPTLVKKLRTSMAKFSKTKHYQELLVQ